MPGYQDTRTVNSPVRSYGSGAQQPHDQQVQGGSFARSALLALGRWICLVLAITIGVRIALQWTAHDIGSALNEATKAFDPSAFSK